MQKLMIKRLCRSDTKPSRNIVDDIENSNTDKHFREPSPQQLTINAELRIREIIEDLQRQTTEELENWSSVVVDSAYESSKASPAAKNFAEKTHVNQSETLFHEGDTVSSPVSLLSPVNAESNLTSGLRMPAQGQKPAEKMSAREQREVGASTIPKDSFPPPDKPSFHSFLKRVAKTPPPPAVRALAAETSRQLPAVIPAMKIAEVLGTAATEKLQPRPSLRPRLMRSPTAPVFPALITLHIERSTSKSEAIVGGQDLAAAAALRTRIRRSRSFTSLGEQSPAKCVSNMKRKPLPHDSPLLISLTEHPAFADTTTRKTRSRQKVEEMQAIEAGAMPCDSMSNDFNRSEMLVPPPPSPR